MSAVYREQLGVTTSPEVRKMAKAMAAFEHRSVSGLVEMLLLERWKRRNYEAKRQKGLLTENPPIRHPVTRVGRNILRARNGHRKTEEAIAT
jgi:hypothetical protein